MIQIAPRISVDENVRFGRPVIQGTRVPVDLVIGKLGGGMALEEVAKEYDLTREDMLAAASFRRANPHDREPRTDLTAALAALFDSWIYHGDAVEQRETGEYLIRVLDEDRLSNRKLFPAEKKGVTW